MREMALWNETRRLTSTGPVAGAQASFASYSSNNKLFQRIETRPLDRTELEKLKRKLIEEDLLKKQNKDKKPEEKPAEKDDKSKPGKEEKKKDKKKDDEEAYRALQEKRKESILQEDLGTQLRRLHNFELNLDGPEPSSSEGSSAATTSAGPARNTLFQSLTTDDDVMLDSSTISFTQYMTLSNANH